MDFARLREPLRRRFRWRRMERFVQAFGLSADMRVLDVGGSPYNWSLSPVRPRLFMTNIVKRSREGGATWVIADARRLPFRDGAFDLVFSNSVIEHVGAFEEQRRFAEECRRVGRGYYVQTPNRRFFVEPHLSTPFIHWLPRRWMAKLVRNFTVFGLMTRPSRDWARRFMEDVWLLDDRGMRELFPEAEIWHERVLGMSKSLMAAHPRMEREAMVDAREAKGATH